MALNIGGTPKKEEPTTMETEPQEASVEKGLEKGTKAMAEAKETLESTPPADHNPEEWGLRVTDRFSVARQRESFMLVEHRPSKDAKGNDTTKVIKTYHPTIDQILTKIARVHTLDLLEQESLDQFTDAVESLSRTIEEQVGALLAIAQSAHDKAKTLGPKETTDDDA